MTTRLSQTAMFSGAAAAPQVVNGVPYYAGKWGMTRQQCLELLLELRAMVKLGTWQKDGTVYDLVTDFVKPKTAHLGYGYAIMMNKDDPKLVNTMVSHAWSENAMEFLEAIIRSTDDNDNLFICAFSLYQNGDAEGPSIPAQLGPTPESSPFRNVLKDINELGQSEFLYKYRWIMDNIRCGLLFLALLVLLLPSVLDGIVYTFRFSATKRKVCLEGGHVALASCQQIAWEWVWQPIWPWFRINLPLSICLFMVILVMSYVLRHTKHYKGRMIVLPNRNDDLYSRLWCVYEIFIARKEDVPIVLGHTMAAAGNHSCAQATCSNAADTERIQREIRNQYEGDLKVGFQKIDSAIQKVTVSFRWAIFWYLCESVFPIVFIGVAYYNIYDPQDCRTEFWGVTFGLVFVILGLVGLYFMSFMIGEGYVSAKGLAMMVLVQFMSAAILEVLRLIVAPLKLECDGSFVMHSMQQEIYNFVFGFCKSGRVALFVGSSVMLVILIYTYFVRKARNFERTWAARVFLWLLMIVLVALKATVLNTKPLPKHAWSIPQQFLPEILQSIVGIVSVIYLPIECIWGAGVFWGLMVDWEECFSQSDEYEDEDDSDGISEMS
jgi:hypothetical protein